MNEFIWKTKYTLEMMRTVGRWTLPEFRFAWYSAGAWVEGFDWKEESPKDCVIEEISHWYQ